MHDHDFWRTPSGALECACGASRRPLPEGDIMPTETLDNCGKGICAALEGHDGTCEEASGFVEELYPLEDFTTEELATVARFGIFEERP